MDSDNLKVLITEIDGLETELTALEQSVKDYHTAYSECRKIEARCFKEIHHQEYRTSQIEQSLKGIKISTEEDTKLTEEIKERIKTNRERISDTKECLPTNNSLYLKVILGGINTSLVDKEEKFQYKEKYEKFKLVVNAAILVVALLDVLFSYRVIDACLHFLLVWYHCTLTIRESILIVNGSRIKGWWRALQFITGIKAGIIIVWPDGLMYDLFRKQFLYYIVYTSFLQFLQFYYQHNCLYRLRALGERYEMDITIQGFHSWMWRGLGFLIPFLYLGYAFQFYNAYTLYNLSKHPLCTEWQVAVSCFIFSVIFLGNIITTSLVVQQKFKEKMINRIQLTLNIPCPTVTNLLKKD